MPELFKSKQKDLTVFQFITYYAGFLLFILILATLAPLSTVGPIHYIAVGVAALMFIIGAIGCRMDLKKSRETTHE